MNIQGIDDNRNLMKSIIDLLKQGDEKIKCCLDKNLVMIIGTTGTGKSTLAQYLAGNTDRLHSKPTSNGTSFIIVDEGDEIGHNSTILSKTVFPSLVEDRQSDVLYCDCPGFSDTRSAAYDIAANYFIHRIVEGSRSVKFVFAIHHAAVEEGYERSSFPEMVNHATKFIKNLHKYKDSIALIVTKVNSYNREGRISDKRIIGGVAEFLKSALKDLEKEGDISFIKFLLSKFNEEYEKIGIFRKPEEAGRLSALRETLEERHLLQKMILEHIQFNEPRNGDFGYTISADSHNHVAELVHTINREVSENLIKLGFELERYYSANEDFNLEMWNVRFKALHDEFSFIEKEALKNRNKKSQQYLKLVIEKINSIDTTISKVYLENIYNSYHQLEFLNAISEKGHQVDPSCIAEGIVRVTEFFQDSSKWYGFLCNLYLVLTDYRVQESSIFKEIDGKFFLKEEEKTLSEDKLHPYLYNILNATTGYKYIKDIILNDPKIKSFEQLLRNTLNNNVEMMYLTDERLMLVGHFVKLRDIKCILQNKKQRCFDILALNKVFIDTDLDLTGSESQLNIIAPTWEIIGEPHITLNGKIGVAHDPPKAADGGERGFAGLPGGAAGVFVAIGNRFINDEHLRISTVGGRGGEGQEGGRGSGGGDGSDPDFPDWEDIDVQKRRWEENGFNVHVVVSHYIPIIRILERQLVDVTGSAGMPGGAGGDGGKGGFGGPAGRVIIINTDGPQPKFKVSCGYGEVGVGGIGGSGGSGGRNGHQQRVYIHRFDISTGHRKFERDGTPKDMGRASDGSAGGTGLSDKNMKCAPEAVQLLSLRPTLEDYKRLLRESLSKGLEVTYRKEFIDRLENDPQVNDLNQ